MYPSGRGRRLALVLLTQPCKRKLSPTHTGEISGWPPLEQGKMDRRGGASFLTLCLLLPGSEIWGGKGRRRMLLRNVSSKGRRGRQRPRSVAGTGERERGH